MKTSEKEPLVSAHQIQNRLNHLNLVTDQKTIDRIMVRIPKTTLQIVQQAKKDKWLPVKIYAEINDYIAEEIGDDGCYNLSFKSFNKVVDSSLVSPFVRAALNLAKIKPSTILKLAPLFWKSIYRNCGDVSTEVLGPTRIRVVINNLPEFLVRSRSHLMGFAGGLQAVNTFTDVKGIVILEKYSVEIRQASFIVSWASNLTKNIKD